MLSIGSTLQDRYRIEHVLGQGGMGSVYLATDTHANRMVAIKQLWVLTGDREMDEAALRQFNHEAGLLKQLDHPRLPQLLDYIEVDHHPYLIMEYVKGRTLASVLAAEDEPLLESQGQKWANELCEVLAYLHGHKPPVIFRDLKPSNVMLDIHNEIRLIDFGISKFFDPTGRTQTFARGAGSPGFSAPEQYSGKTDVLSDIYSLGATLYGLMTKTVPPTSVEMIMGTVTLTPLQVLRPDISAGFAELIHRCMKIKKSERPANVQAVRAMLAGLTETPGTPEPAAETSGDPAAYENPTTLRSPDTLTEHASPTAVAPFDMPDQTVRLPMWDGIEPDEPAPVLTAAVAPSWADTPSASTVEAPAPRRGVSRVVVLALILAVLVICVALSWVWPL